MAWWFNATLHNADEIARKDIRIGRVIIQRAGDVIPQVVRMLEERKPDNSWPRFPAICPACGFRRRANSDDGEADVVTRCSAGLTVRRRASG